MGRKKVLFIHHSTGGNLIKEGGLRHELAKLDSSLELWDHNYNLSPVFPGILARFTHFKGLSNNLGNITYTDYRIILSNNSPREYAEIFSGDPDNFTLGRILSYDIIAFKNCYPTTRISSEKQLLEDIEYYQKIRSSLQKYKDKTFLLLTPPPARKETTNIQKAGRAKKLIRFLLSDKFENNTNLKVFDFFGLLADEDGFLKREYSRLLPWDSHPNKLANQSIAPLLAGFIFKASTISV